ncbi:MAG: hypothetical protein GY913_18715 [Proteobacteria bacterium]|nr:hypothetical protein [Pseudomonadota bacterium]MCP4918943.1 hypothetical protein [Pseudomonadota bacterium]
MPDISPHPLLEAATFTVELPASLSRVELGVDFDGPAPLSTDDEVKGAVRRLLRKGGFKPSGRNKPASEYLIKAHAGGFLGPINVAVDVCNLVSLHSGLPISVVDIDRTQGGLSVRIVEAGSYVFNAAGQELKLDGLLCLHDEAGPCANAVKDSQRTKTHDDTRRLLYVVWGTNELPGRSALAGSWASELLASTGARIG